MVVIPNKFLTFTNINEETAQMLTTTQDSNKIIETFSSIYSLSQNTKNDLFKLQFHQRNLEFAQKAQFTPRKLSTFIEIMNYVLEVSMESLLKQNQAFDIFQELILKHSIERSPQSIAVFTLDEVREILDFALITLFRHYSLYNYVFNPHREMQIVSETRFESSFPPSLPLTTGQEVQPQDIEQLSQYIEHPVEEEDDNKKDEDESSDEFNEYSDPVQGLLNFELRKLRKEMEENMKKLDDEFITKVESKHK